MLSDSQADRPAGTAFETSALATILFESRRLRRVLVILDTCFSGKGLSDAQAWASQIQADDGCLLQLISSSRKKDVAQDGAFAPLFIETISNQGDVLGRKTPDYLPVGSLD